MAIRRLKRPIPRARPTWPTPRRTGAPDLPAAVAEIEQYLKDAPPGIQSAAGRARIPALVAESRAFLVRLKAESEDGKAL